MTIDFKELGELLSAIAANNITELTLKNSDFELTVTQGHPQLVTHAVTTAAVEPLSPAPAPKQERPASEPERATAPIADKKWVAIESPMVGTFYRSPAPDESPFVSVGDRIRSGQTVCIIEAMKLMNEIEAEAAGQVMEVLVENGQPIEFGQTLMYINPA